MPDTTTDPTQTPPAAPPTGAAGVQAGYDPNSGQQPPQGAASGQGAPPQAADLGSDPNALGGSSTAPQAADTTNQPKVVPEPGVGARMLHGILGALGGTEETVYRRDPNTGALIKSEIPTGPGMQFKRIIAGAVQGLAASAGAGRGAGQVERGLALGAGAGMKSAADQDQAKRDQADQDYNTQQQAIVRKAQTALLNQQLSAATFQNSRNQINANFEDAQRENAFVQSIAAGGQGSRDLGVIAKPQNGDYMHALLDAHQNDPGLLKQQAQGNVIGVPHFNAQGQQDGMHYALVTPEWKSQKIGQDQTFYKLVPPTDPKDEPKVVPYTVKAGTMSNGDFWNSQMAAEKEIQGWYQNRYNQQQENKRNATTAATSLEGDRIKAGATVAAAQIGSGRDANGAPGAAQQNEAQMLVDGYMDPSQMTKRGKNYDAQIQAANQYSMQKYGKPFDMAKAQEDYRFANNAGTQNTLRYLDSLTGRDNNSGNLSTLSQMSKDKALGDSNLPALNEATRWTKLMTGNPKVAAYYATLTETADQVAKILQGGGTGSGTSDAKLKQANDLFQKGFTADQVGSVSDTLRTLLGSRKTALIGDNRYLLRQYGSQAQQQTHDTSGATPQTHTFNSAAWAAANPGKDVNAAIAAAKQQGYTVQ